MRRVDADNLLGFAYHPNEGTGLGAVSVQYIRLEARNQIGEAHPDPKIRGVRLAVDRQTPNAELEARCDLSKRRVGAFTAGEAIGDNADVVARIDLAVGEIENVTKNSAD